MKVISDGAAARILCGSPVLRIITNTNRIRQNLAGDKETSVASGVQGPFYKCHTTVLNLDAGNAVRMDTASRVAVRGIRRPNHGTVGVPGDQDVLFLFCPFGELFFRFLLFLLFLAALVGSRKPRSSAGPHR